MRGSQWLYIAALLFVLSLVMRQVPLLLISLIILFIAGIGRLWGEYCLKRVEYQRRLNTNRVFFGEEVQLEVEVANRKPLPLPWIQVDEELPEEVALLKGRASSLYKTNRMLLSNLFSLGWYDKVKRRYPIRCLQRGWFVFGPARIRSGDLFGFFRQEMESQQVDYLMVYPRVLPLEKLGIPSNQPIGDIRPKRHIFEDPILTAGVREYHFGDSLRRIHWKTTARLGQLQTKVFEPTTTMDMGIFLDVRTMRRPAWGSISRLLELGIIAAASIANYAIAAGYRVGLYVNQHKRLRNEPMRIPPSRHGDQLLRILESLAQIQPPETTSISRLILNEGRNLNWGSTVVVISAVPTDDLFSTLVRVKRAGRRVALIVVGGDKPLASTDGLPVYHIRDDVAWREMETLCVEGA